VARETQLIPLARSPLPMGAPAGVVGGWQVGVAEAAEDRLTLADRSPLAKVLVRAALDGPTAEHLVARGRAARDADGTLVCGIGPGEWLLLAPPGSAAGLVDRWDETAAGSAGDRKPDGNGELVSAIDVTSARALLRLTGDQAVDLLATVCGVDFDDRVTPNGCAFRTSVAKVTAEVVRDDTHHRSYLLACDSSYGRYLHGALLDAGAAFGIEATGFPTEAAR
jgi:heterotetrameric sarcosine oxidase gamma subunit